MKHSLSFEGDSDSWPKPGLLRGTPTPSPHRWNPSLIWRIMCSVGR